MTTSIQRSESLLPSGRTLDEALAELTKRARARREQFAAVAIADAIRDGHVGCLDIDSELTDACEVVVRAARLVASDELTWEGCQRYVLCAGDDETAPHRRYEFERNMRGMLSTQWYVVPERIACTWVGDVLTCRSVRGKARARMGDGGAFYWEEE